MCILKPFDIGNEEQAVQVVESPNQQRRRPKKKKKSKKSKKRNLSTEKDNSKKQFQPQRLFSLFPNLGFKKWRSIKVDSQNIAGIFGKSIRRQQAEETVFNFAQRCFYDNFDFKKLRINR